MTNLDKIKEEINTMTSEQFADFCHFKSWRQNVLCPRVNGCNDINSHISCKECIIAYLNSEAE